MIEFQSNTLKLGFFNCRLLYQQYYNPNYQSLVDLIVIDIEFDRKDHNLSFTIEIGRELNLLDAKNNSQT